MDFCVVHTASEAEDPTHAVNHGAGGDTAVNEILERSLSRPSVMTLIPSEHVRGETDKLQRQISHQQIRSRSHEEHPQGAPQQNAIILSLVWSFHFVRA